MKESMPQIGLVYWVNKTSNPVEDFFSEKPEYYYFFAKASEQFIFRVAYGKESYIGNGIFSNVWKLNDGLLAIAESEFKADLIYQRRLFGTTSKEFEPAKVINTPEFRLFSRDKYQVYRLLKEFSPETHLAQSIDEIKRAMEIVPGEQVVIKPRHGEKGAGVFVWNKNQEFKGESIQEEKLANGGYLLQAFVNTNGGIPGVVEGVHDLKFLNIGDSIFANLRTPEKKTLIITGDSPYTEVATNSLPKEILDFRNRVCSKISASFPMQLYSMDIGNTPQGPMLFEINGHTAFPYIHFSYTSEFVSALLYHLKKYSENN
ncbi:MAG: hypothetical protein A3H02_01440 [Candidatus Niyogibacteria bacterium RIFCSPLOWO2_12_FULL_41_13]|uniref:ATP-grasp domain-containing protein n=1 Tax=Candidatus Niyogibacteria bacterium RIFCSPLOWO2_12_FULL_41_13 TaxID=1801726 RepID=A0A1G2F112_9BACT|nr:MAG: hypothetical protein A3H02_01440 [Candidatus Niyogibacteria bacterium RIFCSPLOWO2_12_FULL_41_13]